MKTIDFDLDCVTVQLTEFEVMTLAALIERGLTGLSPRVDDTDENYHAIYRLAGEFRSLGGHFELAAPAA